MWKGCGLDPAHGRCSGIISLQAPSGKASLHLGGWGRVQPIPGPWPTLPGLSQYSERPTWNPAPSRSLGVVTETLSCIVTNLFGHRSFPPSADVQTTPLQDELWDQLLP